MKRRSHRDPVSPEDRGVVFARDRGCILAAFDLDHVCRDWWGNAHTSDDLSRMTIEHVKPDLRMGVRGPSTPDSMVTLCAAANLRPPTKVQRAWFRDYLARVSA